ncbi:hypothetical protein G9A89_001959 [Geosiphon pyriformis]|nr:hypothetical protein G9A89_001959 [Geosiphon pyriformis]
MVRKDAVRIYPMVKTQKIIEQRKTWKAKLVGLPQNCTAHYLSTTLDQIKARFCFIPRTSKNYTRMGCAYIGFDSEASCNNATKKPLVIGDTLVHWVPTNAKECHFCYQGDTKKVTNNIRLAKLYIKKNVSEKNVKTFGGRLYAKMAALRLSYNLNSSDPKDLVHNCCQTWDNSREEKRHDGHLAAKSQYKGEKKVENRIPSQNTTSKSNLAEKNEAYNPEREIKEIKKSLEFILELLKQVKKQGSWSSSTARKTKSMETDNNRTTPITIFEKLCIGEQFDFVIITETKLTSPKQKGVFFGSDKYHAFWESSAEKQMRIGVGILVKKCWMHYVETIRRYYGRLLHLALKFRGKISVHIVGLYMPAFKSPREKTAAKEIRKLLGDIVQNKEIIIVADHKLVRIVADIIKQIRVNKADIQNNNVMQLLAKWKQLKPEAVIAYLITFPKDKLISELLSIKKEYRSTLHARIRLQQQRQIVDNIIKRQQNFELNKGTMIKSILNRKRQRIVLDHVIEKGEFYDNPDEIKKLVNKKAQG